VAALEKTLNTKIEVLDLGTFQDQDELTKAQRVHFWNHQLRGIKNEEEKAFYMERKEAGFKIDPATAEVEWWYAQTLDPYGRDPDLPEEFQQVGREYFARSPGSDIWVHFGDLPEATREALWSKSRLAGRKEYEDMFAAVFSIKGTIPEDEFEKKLAAVRLEVANKIDAYNAALWEEINAHDSGEPDAESTNQKKGSNQIR
jgi:hypothetical protein